MNELTPSITVNVDPTNPGQFFACCGLLELADRLWPGCEGWFGRDNSKFFIGNSNNLLPELGELLLRLTEARLDSSLGDDGLKRLGTLLSQSKSSLTIQDEDDKKRLQSMWKVERIFLSEPFNLAFDWWWDEFSSVKAMKTWAAKQLIIDIVRPMLKAIREVNWNAMPIIDCLTKTAKLDGLPFYFDSANNTQNTPRDYGVAPAHLKLAPMDRPLIELLTFFALQRFRPFKSSDSDLIRYSTWKIPLLPSVAGSAVSGALWQFNESRFEYRMLYRTKYMKAVLPSLPLILEN